MVDVVSNVFKANTGVKAVVSILESMIEAKEYLQGEPFNIQVFNYGAEHVTLGAFFSTNKAYGSFERTDSLTALSILPDLFVPKGKVHNSIFNADRIISSEFYCVYRIRYNNDHYDLKIIYAWKESGVGSIKLNLEDDKNEGPFFKELLCEKDGLKIRVFATGPILQIFIGNLEDADFIKKDKLPQPMPQPSGPLALAKKAFKYMSRGDPFHVKVYNYIGEYVTLKYCFSSTKLSSRKLSNIGDTILPDMVIPKGGTHHSIFHASKILTTKSHFIYTIKYEGELYDLHILYSWKTVGKGHIDVSLLDEQSSIEKIYEMTDPTYKDYKEKLCEDGAVEKLLNTGNKGGFFQQFSFPIKGKFTVYVLGTGDSLQVSLGNPSDGTLFEDQ